MSPTVGTRITTAAGIALLAAGLALCAHGAVTSHGTNALAGAAVTFTALILIALIKIKRWVTDTNAERRDLARAQCAAEEERRRHVAAQGAMEAEQTRLRRDLNAERAQVAATLTVERAAMEAKFEKERFQIQTDAFKSGVLFERAGMLEPEAPIVGNLIQFPKQAAEAAATQQRERSREHGVVGP